VTALALVSAAGLSGCTGSSAPTPTPSTTTTSPSPAPSLTATQQLEQLAALGAKAVYRATYRVRQKHPSGKATWRIWRSTNSLRVDVVTHHSTATLIETEHNTYACSRSGHDKRCFRAAKGDSLPAPLRLLAAPLFSTNFATLANGSRIKVGAVTTAGRFGTCFDVTPRLHKSSLEKANYCFTDAGVLTRVRYPNGNLVQAQNVVVHAPKGNVFHPYSSPTPIPG
jgi:hypothetical protein